MTGIITDALQKGWVFTDITDSPTVTNEGVPCRIMEWRGTSPEGAQYGQGVLYRGAVPPTKAREIVEKHRDEIVQKVMEGYSCAT